MSSADVKLNIYDDKMPTIISPKLAHESSLRNKVRQWPSSASQEERHMHILSTRYTSVFGFEPTER